MSKSTTCSPTGVGTSCLFSTRTYSRLRMVSTMAAKVAGRPIPRFSSSRTRLASEKRVGGLVFLVNTLPLAGETLVPWLNMGTGFSGSSPSSSRSSDVAASVASKTFHPGSRKTRPLASKTASLPSRATARRRVRTSYTASASCEAKVRRRMRRYRACSSGVSPASSTSGCVGRTASCAS